jgi:LuxR family maltose regulon positive regulatory protein
VVTAPAGYGKTTLISDWVAATQPRCAWLSLDADDNQPRVFIRYLLAAIERCIPPAIFANILEPVVGAPSSLAGVAHQLADILEQVEEHFVLVLDDYHAITEPAIHLFLTQLLRYPPGCLRLVLASRIDPPLPLAAMRAQAQLTEIRTRDLRFTNAEMAEYLGRELQHELEAETLSGLMDSTEGWIAGLHLAALLLRNTDAGSAAALVQRHRHLAIDYLASEVFAQQPAALQSFLLQTSILQRMCPALCDAITGALGLPPARQMLTQLEQQDLFIVALDDTGQWFRYHHLFQQFLKRMLRESAPAADIDAMHARASHWCDDHGLVDEAISYALAGNELQEATRLIDRYRHAAMNREDWQQLERWLHLLPAAAINASPQLLLLEAWVLHKYERLTEVRERLDLARALLDTNMLLPETQAALRSEMDALDSQQLFWTADPQHTTAAARRALKQLPSEYASARGVAWVFLAGSLFQLTGLEPALDTVGQAAAEDLAHHTAVTGRVLLARCFLYWMAADLTNLQESAEELLALALRHSLQESRLWAYYFRGCARYARNQLEAAIDDFAEVVQHRHAAAGFTYLNSVFGLAAALHAHGDPQAAQEAAGTVLEYAQQTGDPNTRRLVLTFQAHLAARQGRPDVDFVRTTVADRSFEAMPIPGFFAAPLALADILIRADTPASLAGAGQRIERLERRLAAGHNDRFLIDVLLLKALLNAGRGQHAAAIGALEQSLVLARRSGLVRTFLDAAPALDELLSSEHWEGPLGAFVEQIKQGRQGENTSDQAPSAPLRLKPVAVQPRHPDLIELLTQREMEVLHLLALRMTNKEIAQSLAISTGTVKQHTRSVFQKLHAENRRDAIVQAHKLGFQFDVVHPV